MPDFRVEIRARLAELSLSPVREAEIVEEFSQHFAEEYEGAINRGASEEEARGRSFEELNASDFLSRELKRVERRVPQDRGRMGPERKINLCRYRTGPALRAAHTGQESGFTSRRRHCTRTRHRSKQRHFQRRQRRPAAAVALQESRSTRHHLGKRDASRFPKDTPSPANFLDWRSKVPSSKAWQRSLSAVLISPA